MMERTTKPQTPQIKMAEASYLKFLDSIPPRLKKDVLTFYPKDKEIPLIADIQESSLFMYGPVCTGKTVLAAAICANTVYQQELTKDFHFKRIKIYNLSALLIQLQESHQTHTYGELLASVQTCDLLVLDDLAVNKQTEWAMNALYTLVNYRYENMKTTIFTSNLSLPELAILWGDERVPRRMAGMSQIVKTTTQWNQVQTSE